MRDFFHFGFEQFRRRLNGNVVFESISCDRWNIILHSTSFDSYIFSRLHFMMTSIHTRTHTDCINNDYEKSHTKRSITKEKKPNFHVYITKVNGIRPTRSRMRLSSNISCEIWKYDWCLCASNFLIDNLATMRQILYSDMNDVYRIWISSRL